MTIFFARTYQFSPVTLTGGEEMETGMAEERILVSGSKCLSPHWQYMGISSSHIT